MPSVERAPLARAGNAGSGLPRKSRLLVTGGAGFIGANFVHHWLEAHPVDRLVVLDALTYAGNLARLEPVKGHPDLEFVQGNICDTPKVERLLREEGIDTIVILPRSRTSIGHSRPRCFHRDKRAGHPLDAQGRTQGVAEERTVRGIGFTSFEGQGLRVTRTRILLSTSILRTARTRLIPLARPPRITS